METVLLYILGILIVAVGLILSIGLHEVGHLVPAKLFGQTLWSRRFGETEYGIKAIPLGGYISMAGMYPPARSGGRARNASTGFFETLMQEARTADTVEAGAENRVFYRLATWKRIIIMLGGPVMNLVIGLVLYTLLLCGLGIPVSTTTIESVSECVIPATSEPRDCNAADDAAPGATAGLLPGDRIVEINGRSIDSWDQATTVIRESAGIDMAITVERGGTEVELTATPLLTERYVVDDAGLRVDDAKGDPLVEKVGFLGIGPVIETAQQPVTAVLPAVGDNIARVAYLITHLPQRLVDVANAAFGPDERDPNGPISVVGVGRIAGEITSLDTVPVLDRASMLISVLASLNIALFVFNLVPLLPLDGGHVAGALWEAIRRGFARLFRRPDPGPVDTTRLIPLTLAVVVVLGAMSILLIYADIVKPISIL